MLEEKLPCPCPAEADAGVAPFGPKRPVAQASSREAGAELGTSPALPGLLGRDRSGEECIPRTAEPHVQVVPSSLDLSPERFWLGYRDSFRSCGHIHAHLNEKRFRQ